MVLAAMIRSDTIWTRWQL